MFGFLFTAFLACGEKNTTEPSGEPTTDPSEPTTNPGEPTIDPGEPTDEPNNLDVDRLRAGDLVITEIHKNPCVLGDDADGDGDDGPLHGGGEREL